MLHWTVLSEHDVFGQQSETGPKEYKEITEGNKVLIVEMMPDGRGKLERLISPCPNDYLNTKWQPGMIVDIR